jgi:hypothetical protein
VVQGCLEVVILGCLEGHGAVGEKSGLSPRIGYWVTFRCFITLHSETAEKVHFFVNYKTGISKTKNT